MLLKLAFRNIFRQKRRSFLTGLTIAMGTFLCAVFLGISEGSYSRLIDAFTRDHTGHIQIHRKGYPDKPVLCKTINGLDEIEKALAGRSEVVSWTSRITAPAMAFYGNRSTSVRVIGIDGRKEPLTTRFMRKIRSGSFFSSAGNEVILGAGAAKILGARTGGEIALISQAGDGSVANAVFTVSGVIGKDNDSYERLNCYMEIRTAGSFFALENRYHEIAVLLKKPSLSVKTAQLINNALNNSDLEALPWQEIEKPFYKAMKADKKGNTIMLVIILVLMAVGVLNTVLMTILERTREFGILKALGSRPSGIFLLIVLETVFLAVVSVCAGIAMGMAANFLLGKYGIPSGPAVEIGGIRFEKIYGKVSFYTVWAPSSAAFLSALLVSLLPALRAARIVPVKAIRE